MHNILCLNKISPLGTDRLGENYTYAAEIENPEGILVRSAAMHDMELPNSLLAIARAGAGGTTFPWKSARKPALWCSTHPAQTPTP